MNPSPGSPVADPRNKDWRRGRSGTGGVGSRLVHEGRSGRLMHVYILRLRDGHRQWWVIADADHTLTGRDKESQASVRRRWEAQYGRIGMSSYVLGHRSPG